MARSLTYSRPSDGWLDSLPLGNGHLGAMVEAGPETVHLHLNDGTAWSGSTGSEHRRGAVTAQDAAAALAAARARIAEGRPVDAERELRVLQSRYSQAYLPFADLTITVASAAATDFSRTLSLGDATHSVIATSAGNDLRYDTFISAPDGVLVHRVRSTTPIRLTLDLRTPLRETSRSASPGGTAIGFDLPSDVAPGHEPDEPALTWDLPGIDPLSGVVVAGWRHDGRASGDARVDGVTELVLVLATETTFSGLATRAGSTQADAMRLAAKRVDAALASPFEDLLDRHIGAHRALYDRVSLSLSLGAASEVSPDPDVRLGEVAADGGIDPGLVALLFDYGRYLLISSSRPGGLPATLQGLWNNELQPPWSSNYTLNINTGMNYWAAEALQLPECHEPLLDLVEALAAAGADTARRLYSCRGWVAHHNTDAWAFSSPTSGDASWSQWPMGGIWLVLQLDEHRRFGAADDRWLARFWDVATGAAAFALDWLVEDESGNLGTRPSTSPENRFSTPDGPASLVSASALDRALLADLFSTVEDLAARLDRLDLPIVAEVLAARSRIAGPRITPSGEIEEWGTVLDETDPQHRHVSHLYPLYPGRGTRAPALEAAASRSLDRRGDDSTGWSLVWKLCLRARLRQPDRVADLLRLVFRPSTEGATGHAGGLYRNFFAAHPPFQIDGNLGFPAAVCEMLLQSHSGEISLLPALPVDLPEGTATGLRVRPGLLVDVSWSAGTLVSATLASAIRDSGTLASATLAAGAAGEYRVVYRGTDIVVSVLPGERATVTWDGIVLRAAGAP
ncbi:glycosyl hydrolase family 95 catalytic domain-containing protein [Mycetocola sp.]|uniref:glycosyl hydrolase family 95 catalytic domain-containing protein n=1 Tax=Mycetocola sp. TaxID=1871042 RepID=UPI003988FF85